MTSPADSRRFNRRAKAIRFRFESAGAVHHAVCTNVSAGGAFIKASYVPEVGTTVVLRELFRGNRDAGLRIVGQVAWTVAEATLETPEPGFAVQFREAYSLFGEATLADFVAMLVPGAQPTFERAEREGRAVHLYAFPEVPAEPAEEPVSAGASVDLATEIERLERKQRPSQVRAAAAQPAADASLRYYTRGRPPRKPRTSSARMASARPTGRTPTPGGSQGANTSRRRTPAPPSVARTTDGSGLHTNPRRRRFGGLLGLFGFSKEEDAVEDSSDLLAQENSNSFLVSAEGDPYAERDDWYVHDEDPSEVLLQWKEHEAEGHVDKISRTMVGVTIPAGDTPQHYERVALHPAFPTARNSRVVLHGTVTRVREAPTGGMSVLVRFSKVDERGHPGAFQEYLELFGVG